MSNIVSSLYRNNKQFKLLENEKKEGSPKLPSWHVGLRSEEKALPRLSLLACKTQKDAYRERYGQLRRLAEQKQCAWMSGRHHVPKLHGFMGTHCLVDSGHRKLPVLTLRKTGAAAGPIFTTHVSTGVLTTSSVVCVQAGLALSP